MHSNDNDWTDFQGAFISYVHIDDSSVDDTRHATLCEYCKLSAQQVLDYMTLPSDFAAIISGVAFANDPRTFGYAKPAKTGDYRLYFTVKSGHPVEHLLNNLFQTEEGATFLVQVALILADAAEDEEYAPYLYGYSSNHRVVLNQEEIQLEE